jgi:hypothetical protein
MRGRYVLDSTFAEIQETVHISTENDHLRDGLVRVFI